MPDSDLAQVHAQGAAYRRWQHSAGYRQRRLVADTWCAAFVWFYLAEVEAVNPNSKTLPIPRSRRDAAFTLEIHRRIPVLWDEHDANGNPWGITANNLLSMTDDSDLFQTREDLEGAGWRLDGNVFVKDGKRMLPLYEAKMAHHFDYRYNSFYDTGKDDRRRLSDEEKSMATTQAEPRYWIARDGLIPTIRRRKEVEVPGVEARLAELEWDRGWPCGWREVCRSTDERTAIPAFIPRTAAGHTFPRMLPRVPALQVAALIATQSSLVFDYVSRQKVGGIHMNLSVWKQLPVPTPAALEPHLDFIVPRVLELVYTAYDMEPLARDLGDEGVPFRWDEERRALLRAELDAFFFRMYDIDNPDDVEYILDTFATETGSLKHNEIAKYGEQNGHIKMTWSDKTPGHHGCAARDLNPEPAD